MRVRTGESNTRPARSRIVRALAIFAMLAGLVAGTTVSNPTVAFADEYPTWADVEAARKDASAAKAQVKKIKALIVTLTAEAEKTAEAARIAGEKYREADQKFQEAVQRAAELQEQADAAQLVAEDSTRRAAQMAAQFARTGDGNITANLFVNADEADGLLYGLGLADKISEQAQKIYDQATQDRNSAQAQTDAANAAKAILEELKLEAERLFAEAQEASEKAAAALRESEERGAILAAQLQVLEENRAATEKDYLAGVQARIDAGASLGAGEISPSGWAKPAAGWISSPYGWRVNPYTGYYSFHAGTDIAAGCWSNIYAANGGTVVYAGWNGGYGNYVEIYHGNGISTAYGHISPGGFLVSSGQSVGVGTHIAEVGTTGNSTGCHLHFEVRENGVAIDNVQFLRNQGITLG